MPQKCWCIYNLNRITRRLITSFKAHNRRIQVNIIFSCSHINRSFETNFLVCIQISMFVIPKHRNSYRTNIIIGCMRANYIISTGTALINSPILTDNIVVTDISPTTRNGMVCINCTQNLFIRTTIQPISRMMNNYFIHFLYLLNRPNKFLSILCTNHFCRSKLVSKFFSNKFVDISQFLCSLFLFFSFWFWSLNKLRMLDSKLFWVIRIAQSFISAPLCTRNHHRISDSF